MIKNYLLFFICFFGIVSFVMQVQSAPIDELREKIQGKNSQIADLEKEIEQYQKQIVDTGKQAQTLQGAIKTLDISRNKLNTDIKVTETKIEATNFTLERLALEIDNKEKGIGENTDAIEGSLRQIQQADDVSVIETLFKYKNLSDFWIEVESIERFQQNVQRRTNDLKDLKKDLETKQEESVTQKNKLQGLKLQLADQKVIVESNQKEKSKVLTQTKNTEANYKKLLAEKQALRAAFAKELQQFESELRIAIDPGSFPAAGKGILAWPLDSVYVTQRFGHTDFSKTVQVYNGNGHNGVDFRAAPGTRIKAALSGVVEGVGDTDAACPAASLGKWVFVKHANGLSTMYAHLSLIKAVPGQQVTTGDILGYSGNTGYSTGPHLHFTVYASQGVRIMDRQSKVCGTTYTMPIADLKAYLDPLVYL